MIRFGYVAQNLTLAETTNRTLRLANLGDQSKVRGIVDANLSGLKRILDWNAVARVQLFRIGQGLIPFASHPDFPYDWRAVHGEELRTIGTYAQANGMRLSMHPGQFIQPGSPNPDVVARSLAELRYCTDVLELLGVADAVIVLHIGGAYGEPDIAAARFIQSVIRESRLLRYLALENDERTWSIDAVVAVARALGVPAIVDSLHLALNPGGRSLREALDLALPTWGAVGRHPKVHISSQDPAKQPGAHAWGIDPGDWADLVATIGSREVDIMIEAKGKEQALVGQGLIAGLDELAVADS